MIKLEHFINDNDSDDEIIFHNSDSDNEPIVSSINSKCIKTDKKDIN